MPGWVSSSWTFAAFIVAVAFGVWRLARSLRRWRPQQGTDPLAQEAELSVQMASKRITEGGA